MTGPDPLQPARQNNFYPLIPHYSERCFLLLPGEGNWTLPVYHPEERYSAQVERLNLTMQQQLDIEVTTLLCAHLDLDRAGKRDVNALYIMENHSPDRSQPQTARWTTREELAALSLEHEWQRPIIERWFEEEESGRVPALRPPWSRKGWRDRMTEWTRTELARQDIQLEGPLTQVKHWDISSIWRANTSAGDIYFKATPALFAHEPRMTLGLARIFPEYIPAPVAIATYPDQGWMLLRAFEGKVMWTPSVEQKEDIMRITAQMQIKAASRLDELFAAGCVDSRLDKLPARVAELSRDDVALARITPAERAFLASLLPIIKRECAQLASGPIPQTLMHGDLHGGNVTYHDGHYTIFDWTDGCVTHPFFDLLTFFEPNDPNLDRLRDVYLAEWSAFASPEDLRETFDLALKVGGLHHALSYRNINAISEAPMVTELEGALEYFLRCYLSPSTMP